MGTGLFKGLDSTAPWMIIKLSYILLWDVDKALTREKELTLAFKIHFLSVLLWLSRQHYFISAMSSDRPKHLFNSAMPRTILMVLGVSWPSGPVEFPQQMIKRQFQTSLVEEKNHYWISARSIGYVLITRIFTKGTFMPNCPFGNIRLIHGSA